ncbi:ABC transporter substrate-binding protein, partial [Roseateles sp. GG27B]
MNAHAKAGAQVFANFLLSADAQTRKADISVWGDGTVLDAAKLPPAAQNLLRKTAPGALAQAVP